MSLRAVPVDSRLFHQDTSRQECSARLRGQRSVPGRRAPKSLHATLASQSIENSNRILGWLGAMAALRQAIGPHA
jgi:hypothetical protein